MASIDLAVEQDINLTVRTILHLRQVEDCGNHADETSSTPDVTALASKVSTLQNVSDGHWKIGEKRLTVGLSM